ncbi:unnamed protein product [Linum trigynum]|uniref:Uncharacterized protein n=1 Tax=Linum trigynum TaxID=586398 RepID=A0AAV2EKQ1_9ROSI
MGKGKETLHKRKKRGREESSWCKETTAYGNSQAKAFKSCSSSTNKANKACFKSSSSTEKGNKPSHYHRHHYHRSDDDVMRCTRNDDEKTDGCGSSIASEENYMGGLGVFEFPWLKEGVSGLVCKTEEEDERWWGLDGSFSACLNEIMYNASTGGGGGETGWWPDIAAAGGGGYAFTATSMDKFEETASAWSSILEMEAASTTSNGNHHVDLQQQPAA